MTLTTTIDLPNTNELNAIRAIINDVQEGFNNNDAKLMNAHLAEDAVVVNARGAVLAGRSAIEKATEEGLAAGFLSDATAYYELTDAALLSPDTIAARKNAWSTRKDAEDGNPPEMNALYIFVRRADRWLIWRRQNTVVV
ncbi:SgcJ/EcaC family oxidoreductase [Rhodococcus spelaei]|uniref:SgcJ/EcaC family oxidoreductase n=1 Tax=Rhodococcus spelaei TaxID=2546320 RepID=A0A541BQY5_9NOCA|nr:SgcJ/EcaC family oxidoreductase [Rhodococcus spelaei]TQF74724.1 SgcJ/EcaC family oxidoreductase [Rhodococcus spelaei]